MIMSSSLIDWTETGLTQICQKNVDIVNKVETVVEGKTSGGQ